MNKEQIIKEIDKSQNESVRLIETMFLDHRFKNTCCDNINHIFNKLKEKIKGENKNE